MCVCVTGTFVWGAPPIHYDLFICEGCSAHLRQRAHEDINVCVYICVYLCEYQYICTRIYTLVYYYEMRLRAFEDAEVCVFVNDMYIFG